MDRCFPLQGIEFIWDEDKAVWNVLQHNVPFEKACEAFFDPLLQLEDATPGTEQRQSVIGMTKDWSLLFVVHLEIEDNRIRLISARKATAQERKRYEDNE